MMEISRILGLMIVVSLILVSCNGEQENQNPIEEDIQTNGDHIEVDLDLGDEDEAITDDTEPEEINSEISETIDDNEPEELPEPVDPQTLYQKHQVNEVGHILVVMYHGIKDDPPYHRTGEDFLKDLQFMYHHGYRLISLSDYFKNEIDVPLGFTPILLTFDDGLSSTFSLEEVDGTYQVKSDTAVGILENFIEENPDFGRGAGFFINNNGGSTFNGAGTLEERLNWLVDKGYDIGNHTANHLDLSTLSGEKVQSEIGKVHQVIQEKVLGYSPIGLTYPFGIRPSEENRGYALNGVYEGTAYNYLGGFAVGPTSWSWPSNHISYDPYLIARTRASEGEFGDLWYYFDYYEKHPDKKYISDGDSSTTVIPLEALEFLNTEYDSNTTVITYEPIVVGDAQ